MFNAPPFGAGTTTSGGTESILLSVLSARNKAYIERSVTNPELIVPSTAHAAFHKAASYFKIKIHAVPCPAPSYRVSIPRVRRLINPNTIMLVGSAPNYPHGIVDDIPALSRLAVSRNGGIPLHVDCCLGSFLLPFLSSAGFPSPCAETGGFDFNVPGVTSISVDTHKYGFAPKGNSVILYRNQHLRQYQYFICPDWSGGVYGSPSMAGSRPGALIAGCWASMMSVGEAGYIDSCHKIVGTRVTIQNAINEHPVLRGSLKVLGEPSVSVVAFDSTDLDVDVYDLADGMSGRGWHLNCLQDPPGIHVAVTLPMTQVDAVESLINDLVDAVKVEKEKAEDMRRQGVEIQGEKKRGRAGALYGVAGKIPDKSVVERLVVGFLDTLYKA
jgi:sphinganine-1-phosphate aldolase